MGSSNPFKDQSHFFRNKLLPWTLYGLLPIALIRLYFYPIPLSLSSTDQFPSNTPIFITSSSSSPSRSSPPPPSFQEEKKGHVQSKCDYTNGKWVHDKRGPLYNGTNCGTIKEGQNCMRHGRPDMGYLYWRWRPKNCQIPRFEPNTFLQLLRNKHVAFVGDSMARNQLESLLCMLATSSTPPNLVYTDGEDNKFRRWNFPSHNVNVSIYWSPFLVKGIEKSNNGENFNRLYLDSVDQRWASDLDSMDMLVLSLGHWFLHPAVYFEGDSAIGCHFVPGKNYTEIGFYGVLGKAVKTTLKTIMERRGTSNDNNDKRPIDVILTTFSPAHFEGDWDKLGACSKTEPFKEGEKNLVDMDADMRKTEVDEVEEAKKIGKKIQEFQVRGIGCH